MPAAISDEERKSRQITTVSLPEKLMTNMKAIALARGITFRDLVEEICLSYIRDNYGEFIMEIEKLKNKEEGRRK
jgi:hypothetical protein